MAQPNVGQGTGRLRRGRRGKVSKGASGLGATPKKGLGGTPVYNTAPKPKSGGAPAPAPASAPPKYGPSMTRARADADLVYGDAMLRAKAGVQNAGTWFDQYKQDVANAQQQIGARYAAAQQQVAASAPTVGPAVQTAEGDQAAASRGVVQQAFGNLLTSQGAAQQDYFTGRQTVGSAQQLQSRVQGDAEVQRLAKERDSYTVQQRGKYRDEKHTRALENAAFGLDVEKAKADVAGDAAARRQQRRENRQENRQDRNEVNQYGYRKADWQKMTPAQRRSAMAEWQKAGRAPKTPPGKGSGFTASQQASARKDFRKVFGDIKRNDNGVATYGKDIQKTLTGAGADSLLVRAAWQLYNKGRVDAGLGKALFRDYGIKVKPRKPRSRPTPYSPPADSPGSDAAQGGSTKDLGDVNSRSDAAQRDGATSYHYRPRRRGFRDGVRRA